MSDALIPSPPAFTLPFTASPADIDELGHVNNAVWVRWIQDLATAHWAAVADADADGKVIVRANTTWAMLDKATGRLARVRAEIAAPFLQ